MLNGATRRAAEAAKRRTHWRETFASPAKQNAIVTLPVLAGLDATSMAPRVWRRGHLRQVGRRKETAQRGWSRLCQWARPRQQVL